LHFAAVICVTAVGRSAFFESHFLATILAAAYRPLKATLLVFTFRNYGRDVTVPAMAIDGNKGQVSGADMTPFASDVAFHPDLYTGFHRGIEGAVDRGTKDNEVANVDGHEEIEMVDGSSDNEAPGMTMCGKCAGNVDPMHQSATEEGAKRIGVVRENDFDHFRLALANRTRIECGCLFHSFKDASVVKELSSSELGRRLSACREGVAAPGEIGAEIALCHLLHVFFPVARAPLPGRSLKLQIAMPGLSMIPNEDPTDLDHAVLVSTDAEVNRVGISISRQVRTVAGVSHIAALAQLRVGRQDFSAGRGASAHEAVSER
jgi:hypothetical protein